MTRVWPVANATMLALFLFAAAVQYNDPDPFVWMAIYVAAAAVCATEARRRTPPWLAAGVMTAALLWAASIAYRASGLAPLASLFAEWEMRDAAVEEAREMYGLLIVGVWMLAITIAAIRRRHIIRS